VTPADSRTANTDMTVVTPAEPGPRVVLASGWPEGLIGITSADPTTVYSVSQADGSATALVGANGGASFTGASLVDGVLYGTDLFNFPGQVSSWDIGSIGKDGTITHLSTQNESNNWHGLASNDSAGVLYSMDASAFGPLEQQNLDGSITTIGGGGIIDGRGMAYDDGNGILYAVNDGDDSLYTVSTADGSVTLIGALGTPIENFRVGLAYDECARVLYMNTGDNLYTVDVSSGATTLVGANGLGDIPLDGLAWSGSCDPCDDCPCPEDINRDGTVDTADLVQLLAAWGDCEDGEFACDDPRECGTYEPCTADPDCLCFRLSDGSGWCGSGSVSCDSVDPCEDGRCPAGFVCQVDTCCEGTICVPIETGCATGSAPTHDLPPGTRTNAGVIGQDGQLITQ
jgi:hypothetical protein